MLTKLVNRLFFTLFVLVILLIASYFFYLWRTYIDDKVIYGEAYGFTIGDNKIETYKKINNPFMGEKNIFIQVKVDKNNAEFLATNPNYTIMIEPMFHEVGYPLFMDKNEWNLYFNASFFNTLSLKFCDEKLCEIYRHRKMFEIF